MRSKRGFTLIEMLLVSSLLVFVLGVMGSLLYFATRQLSENYSRSEALRQGLSALDSINRTIDDATGCQQVISASFAGLKCTMPMTGRDLDGDGRFDTYIPTGVTRRGVIYHAPGERVWFYFSDRQGNSGAANRYLWRAVRLDDLIPTEDDIDREWCEYYDSGKHRFDLITDFQYLVSTPNLSVRVILTVSTLTREPQRPKSHDYDGQGQLEDGYQQVLDTTTMWSRWRL